MEAAIATAPKEGAKMKLKQEEDISSQRMLQEEILKREDEKKMKSVAATASKKEAKMTVNAPTSDAQEEEVRGGNENNQDKGGMKDNVTHSNINNHLRELNYGAGAKDDDTDKIRHLITAHVVGGDIKERG